MPADRPGTIRRVIGYVRVSSLEQAKGTSLVDQQNAIRAYAKTRGLKVDRIYLESESAVYERLEKREQVRALMVDAVAGDLVLCDKIDRWSRDPEFTYGSVRQLLERGASFYAVGDRIDPSTPDGDSALGLRVLMAREEYKRIKQRLVGTRKTLRDNGLYSEGLPPLGYRRQVARGLKSPTKNVLLINADAADLVRECFRRCVAGESIEAIRQYMRAHGRPRQDKKATGVMLRNRVYLGEIRDSRGVWIKGAHEAIIAPALFDSAQKALSSRRLGGKPASSSSQTASWLLRELARCGKCGAKMTAAYGGGPRSGARAYTYYYACRAKCGARYVPVPVVEAEAAIMVADRLDALRKEIAKGEEPKRSAPTIDYSAQRERLRLKRERHLELYADGSTTKTELHAALAKLDAERTRIYAAEAEQSKRSPLAKEEVRRSTLAHTDAIRAAWQAAKPAIRRAILSELATEVRLVRDSVPDFRWRTVEEIAANLRS